MSVGVAKYRPSDRDSLVMLMETLQDYLIGIDPIRRLVRLEEYGEVYTRLLLNKIRASEGAIFLAKKGGETIGCIAGIVLSQNEEDAVGATPFKAGRILELVVVDGYRNQGVGSALMKRMERYLNEKRCDTVRVEVFVPNTPARKFYAKLAY